MNSKTGDIMNRNLLLTPLSLSSGALSNSSELSKGEHRLLIFKFGLVQAVVTTILWIIFCLRLIQPLFSQVHAYATDVIDNANFTQISLDGEELGIDVKPGIYAHTVFDEDDKKINVVLTQEEQMNPYYWDDRIYDGKLIEIKGVALMKKEVILKMDDEVVRYKYDQLPFKASFESSKEDLSTLNEELFSDQTFSKFILFTSIAVFILGYILGVIVHVVFAAVVAFFVSSVKLRLDKYFMPSMKRASMAFVGFTYIIAIIIGFRIIFPATTNMMRYPIFEILAFVYVLYIVWKSYEVNLPDKQKDAK